MYPGMIRNPMRTPHPHLPTQPVHGGTHRHGQQPASEARVPEARPVETHTAEVPAVTRDRVVCVCVCGK